MSQSKGAVDPRHIRVPSLPPGNTPAAKSPPVIAFTVYKALCGGIVTKQFTRDAAGEIQRFSKTQLGRGIATRTEIESLDALPPFLDGLLQSQCIGLGVFDLPSCQIVTADKLTDELIASGHRSRTLRFMSFPEHALVLLDHDTSEYMPGHMRCALPADLIERLQQVIPELKQVGFVGSGSSSAGVYVQATGERYPSSGMHLYISVQGIDPSVLAEILRVRCWNAGLGFIALAANGAMLPRTLVDLTVFSPERPIFEAPPVVGDGLGRDNREWHARKGVPLQHLSPVTAEEKAECDRRIAEAMRDPELIRKAAELREAHHDKNVDTLAKTARISIEEARARLPKPTAQEANSHVRFLYLHDVIWIKGQWMTVKDLLAKGAEHDRSAMADPIEGPDYGKTTAKIYFNGGNSPAIHSLAHGVSTTYVLLEFEAVPDTARLALPGPSPIEQAQKMPDGAFPHMGRNGPRATILNVRVMLDFYAIVVRYDLVAKNIAISIPGHSGSVDNFDNSTLAHIVSLANLNAMPIGQIPQFVAAIADQNMVNPVADWIRSKPWDGIDRLPALYGTLTTQDDFPITLKHTLIFRWLLSAVAAALMPSGFSARGVLVLQGRQSLGKTRWIIALVPAGMMRETFLKMDHLLDPNSKDSVLGAIRSWICELGELDGSFNKADLARIKGFITSSLDIVRVPYGRLDSTYQRRTVFAATVNHSEFLVDDTGNTRWWTLPLVAINYDHDIDVQQMWVQVATIFEAGNERWWLSPDEERELELYNQRHRAPSAIRDALLTKLDWDAPTSEWKLRTAARVLELVGYERPTNPQAKECGSVLRDRIGEPTKSQGLTRWMVPPLHEFESNLLPAPRP